MSPSMLALIPARGSSKGIPRKNIRPFLGRPLLAWTVEAAQQSGAFEHILVSTEDEEIADIGRRWGAEAPFRRPQDLAGDTTLTAAVVRHALEWLAHHTQWRPAFVMVLEPTAPARRPWHIQEAVRLLQRGDADSVASVSEVPQHYVPPKQLRLGSDGTITGLDGTPIQEMIHRRQDLPVSYAFNGLIFACRADIVWQDPPTLWGRRVLAQVVDPRFSVDIDRPEDWTAAESRCRVLFGEGDEARRQEVTTATGKTRRHPAERIS